MRNERGTVIVLVALGLIALVAILALVIDVGVVLVNKHSLQSAADLAVLAGAQHLPESPDKAIATANDYLLTNRFNPSEVEAVTVDSPAGTIEVKLRRRVPLHLARVLGYTTADITGSAKARAISWNLIPWGVVDQQFVFGEEYVLKWGSGSSTAKYRGNYHVIDLSGSMSMDQYTNWVGYDYAGLIQIGQRLSTKTGNLGDHTPQGVEIRQARVSGHACTMPAPDLDCPMIITLPVVTGLVDATGAGTVTVQGTARFLISRVVSEDSKNVTVYGHFLVEPERETNNPAGEAYGRKRIMLVR